MCSTLAHVAATRCPVCYAFKFTQAQWCHECAGEINSILDQPRHNVKSDIAALDLRLRRLNAALDQG